MTDSNGSSASKTLPRGGRQGGLRVLAVYPWTEFWSMGEGRGAPSFFLSVTAFGARGHDMHVLMPGRPRSPLEEDYHGVTLHRFHTSVDFMPDVGRSKAAQHARLATSYLMWRRRAAREVRALAARVMPDVLFGMGALGAPVASSVARELALPNVTRLFGTSLGEVLDNPLKSLLRYREKIAFRCDADYIVLCDDGSGGDEIARGLGVDASRLLFWPNGIDKAALRSGDAAAARRGLSLGDARMILSVSRLHSEKRVDRLVHAVPAVLAERGDVSFAGDGPDKR